MALSIPFRAEGHIRVEETAAEAFARSDANQDGTLSFEEFMHTDAMFEALKRDEFKQLDVNSDGHVSREEYYPGGGWMSGFWNGPAGEEPPLPLTRMDGSKESAKKEKELQVGSKTKSKSD